MPELDGLLSSAALDQLGVRLEDAEHALGGGNLFALHLRSPGLAISSRSGSRFFVPGRV